MLERYEQLAILTIQAPKKGGADGRKRRNDSEASSATDKKARSRSEKKTAKKETSKKAVS